MCFVLESTTQTSTTTEEETVGTSLVWDTTDKIDITNYNEQKEYEALQKPTLILNKQSESISNTDIKTEVKNVFKPANATLPKARFISKRNTTHERQILRLRGSPYQFEGFVEMQLSPGSWGIMCDKHNNWKSDEAHIVCKTLGFPR